MSPARNPVDVPIEDVLQDILEEENGEEDINPEPRKTTRKRKRPAETNSLVDAIAGQTKPVGPGLGQSKPPKKKPITHENAQSDVQKPPAKRRGWAVTMN